MTSLRPSRARGVDDALGLLDGLGQRLLAEHVAARLDRRLRVRRVRLGIRVDADDVGLGRGERLVVVAELGHAAELLAERLARAGPRLTRPATSNSGILWYARAWLAPMLPQPATSTRRGVVIDSTLSVRRHCRKARATRFRLANELQRPASDRRSRSELRACPP